MNLLDESGVASRVSHRRTGSVAALAVLLLAIGTTPALTQPLAGKDLRLFYQQNCVGCHGADGSALSVAGKKLRGQDLTNPVWLKRTRDDEMVKTILKGKFFGLAMPGFSGALTRDEAQRIVTDIIRKSTKGKMIEPDAAGQVKN